MTLTFLKFRVVTMGAILPCGQTREPDEPADTEVNRDAETTINILKKVSVISSLTESELQKLASNLEKRNFKKGDYLMKYGEDGTEFYIIVSGLCSVKSEDGVEVAQLSAGDYAGEMALLEKAKRNATLECLDDCSTLVASKELFESVLGNSSKVCINKMYKESVKKGTELIKQGDKRAQTFHVIASGSFTIHVDGDQKAIYKEGMCFGELALIHDAPRAATVTAVEDCVIWTMHRNAYHRNVRGAKQQDYQQRVRWLKKVKLFNSLTKGQLVTMSEAFDEKTYKKNDVIIKQGDIGERFFVIKSGEVKCETFSGESGPRKPGEYFGERALLHDHPRAATITAVTTTVCLELHKEDFKQLLGPLVDEMEKQIHEEEIKTKEFVRNSDFVAKTRGSALLKSICSLDQLETVGILGKGAFGIVSLVIDPVHSKPYALKAMKKCQIAEMGFQDHIVNEKDVMLLLHNDFLVNLRGTFKDKLRVYLLLDVCQGGELFTILRHRRYFDENTTRFMTACVVEAFGYMHSLNVIYRDLKPENLVLDDKGYLKITDFGFAKQIEDQTYTLCGTPEYFAPEIVTGQGHGKAVDWWTLGILVYEMS